MTLSVVNLYKANKNCAYRVISVPKINLLESIGLRVGGEISIQNRYAFGGPVLIKIENAFTVAIGKDIAAQIAVRRVIT